MLYIFFCRSPQAHEVFAMEPGSEPLFEKNLFRWNKSTIVLPESLTTKNVFKNYSLYPAVLSVSIEWSCLLYSHIGVQTEGGISKNMFSLNTLDLRVTETLMKHIGVLGVSGFIHGGTHIWLCMNCAKKTFGSNILLLRLTFKYNMGGYNGVRWAPGVTVIPSK